MITVKMLLNAMLMFYPISLSILPQTQNKNRRRRAASGHSEKSPARLQHGGLDTCGNTLFSGAPYGCGEALLLPELTRYSFPFNDLHTLSISSSITS